MQKNLYLFTGENSYTLDQEVLRWRTNFLQKFGKDSLFMFGPERFGISEVSQALYDVSLFVQKKMIVMSGLPNDGKIGNSIPTSILSEENKELFVEGFMKKVSQIPEDNLVIFISYKPDKRTKLFKFLEKNASVKEFPLFEKYQIQNFVKENSSLSWESGVFEYFLSKIGLDLYHVSHELEKLTIWQQLHPENKIDIALVDLLIVPDVTINNFDFFDHLFVDPNRVFSLIQHAQEESDIWLDFSGMIAWGFKNYVFVIDYLERGIRDPKLIAQETKIHPFALSKMLKNADLLLSYKKFIYDTYQELILIDRDIKTGKKIDVDFWLRIKKKVLSLVK